MFTRSVKILQFFSSAVDSDTELAAAAHNFKTKKGEKTEAHMGKTMGTKTFAAFHF